MRAADKKTDFAGTEKRWQALQDEKDRRAALKQRFDELSAMLNVWFEYLGVE